MQHLIAGIFRIGDDRGVVVANDPPLVGTARLKITWSMTELKLIDLSDTKAAKLDTGRDVAKIEGIFARDLVLQQTLGPPSANRAHDVRTSLGLLLTEGLACTSPK